MFLAPSRSNRTAYRLLRPRQSPVNEFLDAGTRSCSVGSKIGGNRSPIDRLEPWACGQVAIPENSGHWAGLVLWYLGPKLDQTRVARDRGRRVLRGAQCRVSAAMVTAHGSHVAGFDPAE